MTDEQLSALLRLKRYEQPAPQDFDRLLQDIHRRQRSELLHRPLWKIAAERVQTFFSEHSMGHLSYAGALASALVVGVVGIGLMTSGGAVPGQAQHLRTQGGEDHAVMRDGRVGGIEAVDTEGLTAFLGAASLLAGLPRERWARDGWRTCGCGRFCRPEYRSPYPARL